MLKATHSGILKIGEFDISCAVLEDGTRVLVERSVANALGKRGSGTHWQKKKELGSGAVLPEYISAKYLSNYIDGDLLVRLQNKITYKSTKGKTIVGVEATILPDICDLWVQAREKGALRGKQIEIANRAYQLMRGFANVGITALVDEATGYQEIRDRKALEKILEMWIAKELLPWTKRFPNDFYEQMFRLKGWQYRPLSVKRPQVIGHYTDDIVYKRLETGVLEALRKSNPRTEKGHRKSKHHQWLTMDVGHPKLRDHLNGVIALMRASSNWDLFNRLLNRAFPKKGQTLQLALDDKIEIEKEEVKENEKAE
jgi:hypothetical protein